MIKRLRFVPILGLAVLFTLLISACGGTTTGNGSSTPTAGSSSTLGTPGSFNCIQGNLTASGSTALAPLVKAVAQKYEAKCSGATITVNLGGSKTGLANAEAGSVDIGNSDVPASSSQSDLVEHQVAVVVFGIIVNKDVTLTNITTAQLKDIYSGKTTNWSQIGGPNLPIVVVSRPTSSGTRATFQKYILGGNETVKGPASLTTDSTGTVVTNVAQNNGAIGYAATGPAKANSSVTLLSIDGAAPTTDNAKTNTYKFWNIERMYTKGAAKPLAQALIDYMTSADGKSVATQQDFIAITDMSSDAITAHNNA